MAKDFPNGATLVFGGSGGIGREVARSFAQAGSDVAVTYRKKQDVAEKDECIICCRNRRTHIVVPCGHYFMCKECSSKINDLCPICRIPIENKLRVICV